MARSGEVFHGAGAVPRSALQAQGRLVRAFGEACYLLEDVQALPPFLTTLVGDSDLWLFATSNGGVTAGRRSPATALFPYVTEDKLADAAGEAGPWTAILATREGRTSLWRPLDDADRLAYRIRRRLYKSTLGTRLVFEEENLDLGLAFRAGWRTSDRFGFVRECALLNRGAGDVEVALLDGLVNLLPGDADEQLQLGYSCLLDAYKQGERLPGSTLAVFTLAAQVVDRAEPREALHATATWSHGLPGARLHLDPAAREAFVHGLPVPAADRIRGRRGAYLLEADLTLPAGEAREWLQVADVARSQADVAALQEGLRDPGRLVGALREDAARGEARIEQLVASTDGFQRGGDEAAAVHHLATVLFNDLRGGVPDGGGLVPGADFAAFVRGASRRVAGRHAGFLAALPAREPRAAHTARVEALGDPDLARLSAEYLPLCFGRRHGDPSRPWNRFEIRVRDARGAPLLDYQGNWRDIFQNWETLARSFPDLAEPMVARFVSASTVDGHNPYRIGRDGVDWEVPDPDHPWSTIGYWGDHQIVYLLRLVELSLRHHPGRLPAWLEEARFAYAEVPYELRPHAEIAADPRSTIRFDAARHARVIARAAAEGSDGRLLHDGDRVLLVTLLEKLVVPALAKLAGFVPGGGIWMNTQRPEWNDANNALVGYGLSVVTLCHLERYLGLLGELAAPLAGRSTPISAEVAAWLAATVGVLREQLPALEAGAVDDAARGRVMDALGGTASAYRTAVYRGGLSGPVSTPVELVLDLAALGRRALRPTIAGARRPDGLFHAYNLLVPRGAGRGFGVEHLDVMLEGQVAALTTGAVGDEAACDLLDALRASRLYRADQRSYLLYPDRDLPGFLEKNVLPESALAAAPLLGRLLAAGDGHVVLRDAAGRLRFHGSLHNAEACAGALRAAAGRGVAGADDPAEVARVLEAYEAVFHHRAFTGRSGTMFAYEGLGSIYWHMVGKLLLAVQERLVEAAEAGAPRALLERLAAHYRAIRAGMGGVEKSPAEWGAFPLDPYSHSPAHGGARQPGMTGQVKEEVLLRLGELGVLVREGRVAFRPLLLRPAEYLPSPATFSPIGLDGQRRRLELPAGSLAFTLCQVPVVYHLGGERRLALTLAGGATEQVAGDALDDRRSAALFGRTGEVERIDVWTVPAPLA